MPETVILQTQRFITDLQDGTVTNVRDSELTLEFPDGTTSFVYEAFAGGSFLVPPVSLNPFPDFLPDGMTPLEALPASQEALFIGRLLDSPEDGDGDAADTVYFEYQLSQQNSGGNIQYSYIGALANDPLPTLETPADVDAFFTDNEGNFRAIPEGEPFGPGEPIALSALPLVEDGEDGDVIADGGDGDGGDMGGDGTDGDGGMPGGEPDAIRADDGGGRLDGGATDDVLIGGAGRDIIVGGGGTDVMSGGAGRDFFVLDALGAQPAVTVTDFSTEERDVIVFDDRLLGLGGDEVELRGLDAAEGFALLADGTVGYSRAEGLITIDTDGDGTVDASISVGPDVALGFDNLLLA